MPKWSEMLSMMHINFIKYDLKFNPNDKKIKIPTFKISRQQKGNETI